jgi:hypothetical protein
MTLHDARVRIRIEFIEMPGLKLTAPQVARLCGLPKEICDQAVDTLVGGGFLAVAPDGSLVYRGIAPPADSIAGSAPRAAAS